MTLVAASRPGQGQTPEMLGEPVAPLQLADNFYYVGTRGISIFLFTTPHGHLLLNAGFETTVPLIERSMASLGFSLKDVKMVLVGHAHPDHVAGLRALQQLSGARIVVGARDADAVEKGSDDPEDHWPGARVWRRVGEGAIVRFGKWRFVAHSTPGHTPGCTTWTTTLRRQGHALDTQFRCSTSVPGYTQLVNNKDYPAIARDYAATFRRLSRLPCTTFFSEHPQGFRFERKRELWKADPDAYPFTDPAGCRSTIAEDVASYTAMLTKQRAAAKAQRDSLRP